MSDSNNDSLLLNFVTITGEVTDNQGQALPGVNVHVKGSNNPSETVLTDVNGNYKISFDQKSKVLIFSYMVITHRKIRVGDRKIINVKMTEDVSSACRRVVVTGYASKQEIGNLRQWLHHLPGHMNQSRSFKRINNNFNTEGYASVNENGFKNVKNNPLSTFSIDVDNASYSNITQVHQYG